MNEHLISRRPFLKTTLGAGVAATMTRGLAEQAEDDKDKKKLGWAVVGLGNLSKGRIGPALLKTQRSKITGVVTGTPEKAAEWKTKYDLNDSGIYDYDNFDEVIDNPDIDVVYLVLPNSMHHEFTLRAAKAGKHVYVEKPMATSAKECREMIAACDEAGVHLGVAYRLQFEPHHAEMMRFAREKTFGEVRHINAGFGFRMGGSDRWRLKKEFGGGAILDVGVYAIQGVRYIFDEEPTSLSALETKTDKTRFAEVDETTNWTMKFASGKTANLFSSFNLGGYNQLTAFANKGRFGMDPCFGMGGQKGWTSDPKIPLDFPQTDHFEVQMDMFSLAIMNEEKSRVSGEEGLKDHLVMDAIFESLATGKEVAVGKV